MWVIMGASLQCIPKYFYELWSKRPIHCWGKKSMGSLLPKLSFPSTSCTGVFYRLMFVVFSSMPRTYKRKTESVCYSQDNLERALEDVRNGMSVRHASLQQFTIKVPLLRRQRMASGCVASGPSMTRCLMNKISSQLV